MITKPGVPRIVRKATGQLRVASQLMRHLNLGGFLTYGICDWPLNQREPVCGSRSLKDRQVLLLLLPISVLDRWDNFARIDNRIYQRSAKAEVRFSTIISEELEMTLRLVLFGL